MRIHRFDNCPLFSIIAHILNKIVGEGKQDSRWWLAGVSGVFLVALAIRLFVLYETSSSPVWGILFVDSAQYDTWARTIAAGDWLGEGVFFMAPLYPYFLGALYALFGVKLTSILVVQSLVGSASCGLLAVAGREFFGARVGIVAGVLLAVYPVAVFSDTLVQKSVLDLFLVSLLLAVLGRALRDPSPCRWLVVGAALGGLMLTRENAVALLPVLLCSCYFRGDRPRWRGSLVHSSGFLLGMALLLVPVAVRNLVRGGEFFFTSAQFGYNLYIGNNPLSDGIYMPLIPGREGKEQHDAREVAEKALGRPLSFGEVSGYWRDKSMDFIIAEPTAWLKIMANKVFLLINAVEIPDSYDQYTYGDWSVLLRALTTIFHFGILFPLSIAGVVVTWSRRERLWPLYFLGLAYAASVAMFFVMSRYRLPVVPLLALFAAAFIVEALRRPAILRSPALLMAMVIALVANWPSRYADEKPRFKATTLNNIVASIAYQPGREKEVLALLGEAIRLDPHFGPSYYFLGLAYQNTGQLDESLKAYQTSASMLPDIPDPYHRMGQVHFAMGRPGEAIRWYRKALSIDPYEPQWLRDLAQALRRTGDITGEWDALQRATILEASGASAQ